MDNITLRLWILRFLISLAFIFLVGRLAYLQLFRGNYYQELAEGNRTRSVILEAPRGVIFDRNGKALVRNEVSFTLITIPEEAIKNTESIDFLAKIKNQSRRKILKELLDTSNQYEPIKIKEHMDFPQFAEISESLPIPGVYLLEIPTRRYLNPLRDAHMLGYVGEVSKDELKKRKSEGLESGDIVGKDGIEKSYDRLLRGKNGAQEIEVDASGRLIKVLGEVEPQAGNDLYLTVDDKLQEAAWRGVQEEQKVLKQRNGEITPASVVALNPNNGEILVYLAWPSFNPNWFSLGITEKQYSSIIHGKFDPLLNRPIESAYPSGSTFKMITGSAGLQEKVITPDKPLYCPGYFSIPGITFNCFIRSGHGSIKFVEAVAQSCDVYFYQVGHRLGIDRLDRYSKAFGVGQLTGVDLPGESPGLLPTPEWKKSVYKDVWYPAETINMAIGQGYLQITPIQLVTATESVANGGTLWRPHFYAKALRATGEPYTNDVPQYPQLIGTIPVSQAVLTQVKLGMKGAVDHGTATAAKLPNVIVSGKTGTAENVKTALNPYGRNHAWFESFAPFDKPQIAAVVMMEQSGGYGGGFAAPVAKFIYEAYFGDKKSLPSPKHD